MMDAPLIPPERNKRTFIKYGSKEAAALQGRISIGRSIHKPTGLILGADGAPITKDAANEAGPGPEQKEVPVKMHNAKAIAAQWLGKTPKCKEKPGRCIMRFMLDTNRVVIDEPSWWTVLRVLQVELIQRGILPDPNGEQRSQN